MPAPGPSTTNYIAPGGSILGQLMPFLQHTDQHGNIQVYDPQQWLSQYGMYLTPYDIGPSNTLTQSLADLQRGTREQHLDTVDNVSKGIALSGFAGSYLGDRAARSRDKLALELQANYNNMLEERRDMEMQWQAQNYADLAQLGQMGAFLPGLDEVELLSPTDEVEFLEGGWSPWMNTEEQGIDPSCICIDGSYSSACCPEIEGYYGGDPDDPLAGWTSAGGSIFDLFNTPAGQAWLASQGWAMGEGFADEIQNWGLQDSYNLFQQYNPMWGNQFDHENWYEQYMNTFDWVYDPDMHMAAASVGQLQDYQDLYFGETNEAYASCLENATTASQMQDCYETATVDYTEDAALMTGDWENYLETSDYAHLWDAGLPVGLVCQPGSGLFDSDQCQDFMVQYQYELDLLADQAAAEDQEDVEEDIIDVDEGEADQDIDYDVDMEDDEDWDPDGTMGGMVS